jgi:hypothetical protein
VVIAASGLQLFVAVTVISGATPSSPAGDTQLLDPSASVRQRPKPSLHLLPMASLLPSLTIGAAPPPADDDQARALAGQPVPLAEPPPDESLMVGAVSGAIVLGFLSVGTVAWWDDGLEPFSLEHDGFGEDAYAGGGDKIGHLYSAYLTTSVMVPIYEKMNVPRTRAVWFATAFTTLLFNGFEVIDGFTDFGFEYVDVIANSVGIGLGTVTQLFPAVGAMLGVRIAYVPSQDFLDSERGLYIKLINDYSGMLFYGDIKLKGVFEAFGADPGLARYLLTGVVYGTDQYSPDPPAGSLEPRARNLGIHFGISMSEILRWVGQNDQSLTEASGFFDYFALPFTSVALMNDLNSGRWFVNFGIANRFEAPL